MTAVLSILFAAAPFGFGLFRAITTGNDFRMLWMALAAFLGLAAVAAVGKPTSAAASSAIAFIVATVFAAVVAYILGATAAAGVWGVAIVFGLCCAASHALWRISRPL